MHLTVWRSPHFRASCSWIFSSLMWYQRYAKRQRVAENRDHIWGILSCMAIFIGQNRFSLCELKGRACGVRGCISVDCHPLTRSHGQHWPPQPWVGVNLSWDSAPWGAERELAAAKGGPEKEKHFRQVNEICQQPQGSRAWSPRMQEEWKGSQQEEAAG